jgi:hypothetical protein
MTRHKTCHHQPEMNVLASQRVLADSGSTRQMSVPLVRAVSFLPIGVSHLQGHYDMSANPSVDVGLGLGNTIAQYFRVISSKRKK